uniref:Helicase ATP-binding domain-containing protein n=1 Tax=Mycena chlorophos TaxID=658473 RepID=A0ABQ0LTV2_MYCCL|nr:predicted protein [Mycena chlorophos]
MRGCLFFIATTKAAIDAVLKLLTESDEACAYHQTIIGSHQESEVDQEPSPLPLATEIPGSGLNASQAAAVQSVDAQVSLIWGPPGTGKTTVVVQILKKLLQEHQGRKILMTASTHNAVDNVLERFIRLNATEKLLEEPQLLRVATDANKVNRALSSYTIDARVGGDMNENNKLYKRAQERLKAAMIVFTTCAGAGLGVLRKEEFDIVVIDEASQITEPVGLIPLVKGASKAILVGDHVQLRPIVKNMGRVLQSDISLMERLYTGPARPGMVRTMLDTQYRFPQELAQFPSTEFYEGNLKTAPELSNSSEVLQILKECTFPWPTTKEGTPIPTVFIPCSVPEERGRSSWNPGQIALVKHILPMFTTRPKEDEDTCTLSVAVLSPYATQVRNLRGAGISQAYTIDSFQGREADIIIFSSVRCNAYHEIGFLDDPRRLNVMWTRARLALILIGDRDTLADNALWKRAMDSCVSVQIEVPQEEEKQIPETGKSYEVERVAQAAVAAFARAGIETCLVGGMACAIYGNLRTPSDVDIVCLTDQHTQAALKVILTIQDTNFYTVPSKDPRATYRVLWYRLGLRRSCKVDVLLPGVMNIPSVPTKRIVREKQRGDLPLMPFLPLLLLKFQAWQDHGEADKDYLRRTGSGCRRSLCGRRREE